MQPNCLKIGDKIINDKKNLRRIYNLFGTIAKKMITNQQNPINTSQTISNKLKLCSSA